jgi:hypothetical protein
MASPIGYLIHPDPRPSAPLQQAQTPLRSADRSRTPLIVTPSGPDSGSASESPTQHGFEDATAGELPNNNHSRTQPLYQCAECLRM